MTDFNLSLYIFQPGHEIVECNPVQNKLPTNTRWNISVFNTKSNARLLKSFPSNITEIFYEQHPHDSYIECSVANGVKWKNQTIKYYYQIMIEDKHTQPQPPSPILGGHQAYYTTILICVPVLIVLVLFLAVSICFLAR